MTSKAISPNHREILYAQSSISGQAEYLTSTNHVLNSSATIGGSPLPISGASTGVGVAILDGSGNQITSFGGGTQYTDGGTPPTHPIGNALEFNNAGTWATVSTTNPLPVSATISTAGLATSTKQSDGSQKTQIVDGSGNVIGATSNALDINIKSGNPTSITANAGTNLNTSALALETGGNLAAIKTDVDKIPSQGQALAAASTPVVLPVAQITTLTPLATVTTTQGTAAAVSAGWPVIGGELADTTGTFTNGTQTTSIITSSFDGYSTVIVSINGTYGTATGVFETSDDSGTTWYSVNAARTDGSAVETGYTSLTNTNRMWTLCVSGADQFRVRSTAVASGTANIRISIESMPTSEAASVNAYLTDGTNGANILKADGTAVAQNAQLIGGTGYTTATLTLNAGSPATQWFDMLNYPWLSFEILTNTTPATLTPQTSGDGSQTNATGSPIILSGGTGYSTTTTSTNGNFQVARVGRYFRISSNVAGGNTVTLVITFYTIPGAYTSVNATANGTFTVQGGKTNNNAAPGATNVGVLPAIANATQQSWTEGDQVLESVDLKGNQRIRISDAAGNDRGANVDSNNNLQVGQATAANLNATVVGTGTLQVQTSADVPGTGATNLGKAEDAASASGDTGVFTLGVRNDTLADTTNTNGDYTQTSTDIKGRVITAGAPRSLKGTAQVSVSNTTSETTIIAATASTFHDVYGIILANTGASTTKVSIRDDTAGTVRAIIEVPTLETRGFMLPVDSAVPQTAVNKNWTVTCGTATTALEVTAFYVSMV